VEKEALRIGNIAKFVEAVGAWVHGGGSLTQVALFLGVSLDWLWSTLIQTGLAGCDGEPTKNATGQDVINVVLLCYVASLMRRTRFVGERR